MDKKVLNEKSYKALKETLSIWDCFVCKMTPVNPRKIRNCGHVFCYNCVSLVNNCPKCKAHYAKTDLKPCLFLKEYVSLNEKIDKLFDIQRTKNISDTNTKSTAEWHNNINEENVKNKIEMKLDNDKKSSATSNTKIEKLITSNIFGGEKSLKSLSYKKKINSCKKPKKTQPSQSKHMKGRESPFQITNTTVSKSLESLGTTTNSTITSLVKTQSKTSGDLKCPINDNSPKSSLSFKNCESSLKRLPQKQASIFKVLIPEIEKRNSLGETPLHTAVSKTMLQNMLQMRKVESLLHEGANPNTKDFAGWTPLVEAVSKNNVSLVNILLKHGALVNTPAILNLTPLIQAIHHKNKEIITLLLEHGADVNIRSIFGHTALSLSKNDEEIHNMLLNRTTVIKTEPPPAWPELKPHICCNVKSPDKINRILRICAEFNIQVKYSYWPDATHIITDTDAASNCECNSNILRGILAGIAIVNIDWLFECYETKTIVPADNYMINGTKFYPYTGVSMISRLNAYKLNPKLFNGCHISLVGTWTENGFMTSKNEVETLVEESGAVRLYRVPNPETIPESEQTIMFHSRPSSSMEFVSHIILYPPNFDPKKEPMLKYNMKHVKTLSTTWFIKCIQTFTICEP